MKLRLAVLVLLGANTAFADENSHITYFEGAIGRSALSGFCESFNSSSCEKQDQAFRVTGGILITNAFALDASYFSFGQAKSTGVGYQFTQQASSYAMQWSWRSTSQNKIILHVKGGAAYINVDTKSNRTCICANEAYLATSSYSKVTPIITLGLEIPVFKEISAMTQIEYFPDVSNNSDIKININMINMGIRKNF